MKKAIWHKRIPTLFGLLLIIVGIGITTYMVGTGSSLTTSAGPSEVPQNLRITNLTNDSFSVSYTTEAEVIGSVNYGKDTTLGQTSLDDRDVNGKIDPHFVHYITIKNLEPSTTYYFSITSGSKEYLQNENPYEITTSPDIGRPITEENLIKGHVIFPQDSAKEAIVYISAPEANTISSTVDSNGNYSILLDILRDKNLTSYFGFNEKSNFNMLVQGQGISSEIDFTIPLNKELAPVILSENFDFTQTSLTEQVFTTEENFSSLTSGSQSSTGEPKILTPNNDQKFIDNQPRFTGTAIPNSTVSIEIHSNEAIKAQVTTDSRGNWSYRPPSGLSPGNHTITIFARDSSGILRTITQTFSIFESGTQVAESATPSASPIPTSPPVITIAPTPIPTIGISPTLAPTLTPTPTIIPVSTPIPTIGPPIDSPGISLTLFGIMGIGITGLGALILLYNRNAPI
ncbi:MAG: Ig-like domain-containing protein [Patescibacteria group bacterium]